MIKKGYKTGAQNLLLRELQCQSINKEFQHPMDFIRIQQVST